MNQSIAINECSSDAIAMLLIRSFDILAPATSLINHATNNTVNSIGTGSIVKNTARKHVIGRLPYLDMEKKMKMQWGDEYFNRLLLNSTHQ